MLGTGLLVVLAARLARRPSSETVQRNVSDEATVDPLSGLANRKAFDLRLEAALVELNRGRGTKAVLILDLDDFKEVNDTLGHAAGDEPSETVRTVSRDVRHNTRDPEPISTSQP